jgi:hypothetical protein
LNASSSLFAVLRPHSASHRPFANRTCAASQAPAASKSQFPSATNSSAKPSCISNGTYVNSKGQMVPRPEDRSTPPKGTTAQCRDGTYSFSKSRRGTCSHHGGVGQMVMTRQGAACSWSIPGPTERSQSLWRAVFYEWKHGCRLLAGTYPVSLGSSPDQFGAEGAMGRGERSRAQTQAHNISGR